MRDGNPFLLLKAYRSYVKSPSIHTTIHQTAASGHCSLHHFLWKPSKQWKGRERTWKRNTFYFQQIKQTDTRSTNHWVDWTNGIRNGHHTPLPPWWPPGEIQTLRWLLAMDPMNTAVGPLHRQWPVDMALYRERGRQQMRDRNTKARSKAPFKHEGWGNAALAAQRKYIWRKSIPDHKLEMKCTQPPSTKNWLKSQSNQLRNLE